MDIAIAVNPAPFTLLQKVGSSVFIDV